MTSYLLDCLILVLINMSHLIVWLVCLYQLSALHFGWIKLPSVAQNAREKIPPNKAKISKKMTKKKPVFYWILLCSFLRRKVNFSQHSKLIKTSVWWATLHIPSFSMMLHSLKGKWYESLLVFRVHHWWKGPSPHCS